MWDPKSFERLKRFGQQNYTMPEDGMTRWPSNSAYALPGHLYNEAMPEQALAWLRSMKYDPDDIFNALVNGKPDLALAHLDNLEDSARHVRKIVEHMMAQGGTDQFEESSNQEVSGD